MYTNAQCFQKVFTPLNFFTFCEVITTIIVCVLLGFLLTDQHKVCEVEGKQYILICFNVNCDIVVSAVCLRSIVKSVFLSESSST